MAQRESPTQFELEAGAQVPHTPYWLVQSIGKGYFGEVWKAVHPTRGELYALKFCKRREALPSFRNEVRHLDRIKKAGTFEGFVVLKEIFDEETRELPFVAYEYIEGVDFGKLLEKRFAESGRFTPFEAAEVIYELASIMARIHTLKDPIVHRDLKPSNILLLNDRPPWRFKIADFGLGVLAVDEARAEELTLTDIGRWMPGAGTLLYMSYEQRYPEHVGDLGNPSDDVHALGVIWYELLTKGLHQTCLPWTCAIGEKPRLKWPFWPPSLSPKTFPWKRLRKMLLKRGMTEPEADLLESCLKRRPHRPEHAGVLAAKIRELYPPLREEARKDAAELERQRRTGCDWLGCLYRVAKKQLDTWSQGANHSIPEAHWLKGLCFQHGIGMYADLDKARECFRWASIAEYPNARCDLALLDAEDQREQALELLKKAADQGHAEAAFRLAKLLSEGRAIDVLPFVPSGDPDAIAALVTWNGEDETGTDCWAGDQQLLARYILHLCDGGEAPELPIGVQYDEFERPPNVDIFVLGYSSCGVPPIRLLLDCPIGELLNLSPEVNHHLVEVFGRMSEEEMKVLPPRLKDILSLTEKEYSLKGGAECTFAAMRAMLAQLWCDPWLIAQQKTREFVEKAASLGCAKAQLWLAKVCDEQERPVEAEKWLRLVARRENWEGTWQGQLQLAKQLFAFFKTHEKTDGAKWCLDEAFSWCARAKTIADEVAWIRSGGDELLDRIWAS